MNANVRTSPPNEAAMQQAWRFRLWGGGRIKTGQGVTIIVEDPGKLNTGPGPDFKDARIRFGEETMAGCVEIHRRASDWHRHGHDGDSAYDNVILHVVGDDDCRILRHSGEEIPQAVISISPRFADLFNTLLFRDSYVLPMCGGSLHLVEGIFRTDWLTSLAFERLMRKADDVTARLKAEAGDWHQTVYVTLARGFGFGNNADIMERVARSVNFRYLLKHSDDIEVLEAILLGQAGLLNTEAPADDYESALCRDYTFYARKYNLTPVGNPLWRMSSRNTAGTPFRRLAFLAALVCRRGSDIGAKLCRTGSVGEIKQFFDVSLTEYWNTNYAFARPMTHRSVALGRQSLELLMINVVAPIIYARGLQTGDCELFDTAVAILEGLSPEDNGITRGFAKYDIAATNAFTSQALIQLHKEYCERRRCLDCRLGCKLLSQLVDFTASESS